MLGHSEGSDRGRKPQLQTVCLNVLNPVSNCGCRSVRMDRVHHPPAVQVLVVETSSLLGGGGGGTLRADRMFQS